MQLSSKWIDILQLLHSGLFFYAMFMCYFVNLNEPCYFGQKCYNMSAEAAATIIIQVHVKITCNAKFMM